MDNFVIFIVLILFGIVGYRLFLWPSKSRVDPSRLKKTAKGQVGNSTSSKWRSVKIRPGLTPCKMASDQINQIFLAVDAPNLPLEGCTRKKCLCKYVFLADRRDLEDRREYLGHISKVYNSNKGDDRRLIRGRRLSDSLHRPLPEYQV